MNAKSEDLRQISKQILQECDTLVTFRLFLNS